MNARTRLLALLAATRIAPWGGILLCGSMVPWGGPAQANTVAGDIITGNLTALNGRQSLSVDGRTYRLRDGSAAAAAAAHLVPGQSVTVQLDGPASSASSQVINVVPQGRR